MKPNIGQTDRTIRIIAGVALLFLFFFVEGPLRYIGLLGLVLLATGIVGWCPPYALLGISTCAANKDEKAAS